MYGRREKQMTNESAPSSTVIEQLVLGAILQNEENYWSVAEMMSMDLFGSDDHQKIYAIMHELASDGRAIRVPIVAARLGKMADGQDPEAYLSMLLHLVSKEDNVPLVDYTYELRSTATRRRVIKLAEGMIKSAKNPELDPDQIVDRANERLADISRDATVEFEKTLSQSIREIYDAASDVKGRGMALRPCLIGLEEMIGYYPPGSLILWGGGPGSGKTAMAMQQMLFTTSLHSGSLFELEMDHKSLVARSISSDTGISARDIMRGLSEGQFGKLIETERQYAQHKLRIVSPSKMSIDQIRSRAFSHKRKFGLDMLVVDHLKLVGRHSKYRMDPVERAYENARDLKSIAKDLNCVVVALCQFTKSARQKEVPEPEMEDFYGGSLEEHADIILANFNRLDWLERNPPRTNQAKARGDWDLEKQSNRGKIEVYKLKDRFGPSRDRRIFIWDAKNTRFHDQGGSQEAMDFGGLPV